MGFELRRGIAPLAGGVLDMFGLEPLRLIGMTAAGETARSGRIAITAVVPDLLGDVNASVRSPDDDGVTADDESKAFNG